MKTIYKFKKYSMIPLLSAAVLLTGCEKEEDEVPEAEHEHEVITNIHLVFTNAEDETDFVEAEAKLEEGDVDGFSIVDTINLEASTKYNLTFEILNVHEDEHEVEDCVDNDCDGDDGDEEHEGEDIGAEILEEADEHQVFFEFTEDIFTDPLGVGNIGDVDGKVNYNDYDDNENPLGLSTTWTTSAESFQEGTFRVMLMHQPGSKSDTSTSEDGDADFDLEFVININGSSIVAIGTSSNLQ